MDKERLKDFAEEFIDEIYGIILEEIESSELPSDELWSKLDDCTDLKLKIRKL